MFTDRLVHFPGDADAIQKVIVYLLGEYAEKCENIAVEVSII